VSGWSRTPGRGETKGGEALPEAVSSVPRWRVLWTHSNCEQRVRDQLSAKGFELFLPLVDAWCRRGGLRRRSRVPLFNGYLFLRHAIDKASYIEIMRTRGLVAILGDRWDRLATVPAREIEAIRRIIAAKLPALPHPYLRDGQRVRITRGPLTDVEGVLVRSKPNRGLLVVSVHLLQRSVAAHVDCTAVVAA
jgi:transcription termination/antitermination protein NusG